MKIFLKIFLFYISSTSFNHLEPALSSFGTLILSWKQLFNIPSPAEAVLLTLLSMVTPAVSLA